MVHSCLPQLDSDTLALVLGGDPADDAAAAATAPAAPAASAASARALVSYEGLGALAA